MSAKIDPTVEFFNDAADHYDRVYSQPTLPGYVRRVRREKVLRLFDQPGGSVVDVGCGPAVMTAAMLDRGCTFWGVDPSARMIEIARSRFPESERVHFMLGGAGQLDLPDNSVDAALCMGVIDALSDPRQAVREMLRVVKPGGTVIIEFPNQFGPYSWWKLHAFYPAVSMWHNLRRTFRNSSLTPATDPMTRQRRLFSERAAHELFRSQGASVVESVGYYYCIFLSPLDELLPRIALLVTRQFEEGRWPVPRWMGAGWIVKARKN